MPTLVPGASKQGFTLLELLVVIVVLSIAAGLIVVRGTPGDSNYLESDAKKLAQLLRIAQQESLLKSKDIRFVAGDEGYAFEEFTGSRWVPVTTEPLLRPRQWDNGPFKATLINEGLENRFLTLESQTGLKRQAIVLQRNEVQVVLESQASGVFKVGKPIRVLNRNNQNP
ncbi:Type II secretion system protein GspH [Limnobacter sp. 130]|jgi:general secretion pathway protein H|uniref:prepilin-type N-terminal cleavage/methylation domain-containing protein n=1 Tax=Limnobacter sp. 130 TaxID=2653147 RepID=UPI0012F1249F|nr:prepilin-type N-terminal cleavage/methylation domain-containing protein [Limnobacter sp. 130]VWX32606.1 Type II secretion system protein GspH [Limnobacter sp. 130]